MSEQRQVHRDVENLVLPERQVFFDSDRAAEGSKLRAHENIVRFAPDLGAIDVELPPVQEALGLKFEFILPDNGAVSATVVTLTAGADEFTIDAAGDSLVLLATAEGYIELSNAIAA